MRARWLLGGLAAIVCIAAGLWLMGRPRSAPAKTSRGGGTKLFETVFAHVRDFAVDSVGDQELYRRASAGVIDELDDPYALLLLPGQQAPDEDDAPPPQGLYLDRRDGQVVVVAAAPGSPADSAGVRSGDQLVAVDSVPVDASRVDLVSRRLRGQPGSRVTLRLRRAGTRGLLTLELTRDGGRRAAALATMSLSGGVAAVRIRRFPSGVADSVRSLVQALRVQGARALVMDLRGTVGGSLADGVALADLFLDAGAIIAVTRGRPSAPSERFADSTASPFDSLPLAILVDAGTAGAGEVVAGALQDHDRAAVLGSLTYGRGVTQRTFPLGGGASLRLTTALWMTPSGRQIQRPPRAADGDSLPRPKLKSDAGRPLLGGGGIMPDRLVAETGGADLALAEARSILLKASSTKAVFALLTQP